MTMFVGGGKPAKIKCNTFNVELQIPSVLVRSLSDLNIRLAEFVVSMSPQTSVTPAGSPVLPGMSPRLFHLGRARRSESVRRLRGREPNRPTTHGPGGRDIHGRLD